MKKYKIKGKEYEFYSIAELAEACGRKPITIRKAMERGILPEANLRDTAILIHRGAHAGEKYEGRRLYSRQLVQELSEFFRRRVRQGSRISSDMKDEINAIFLKERKTLGGN